MVSQSVLYTQNPVAELNQRNRDVTPPDTHCPEGGRPSLAEKYLPMSRLKLLSVSEHQDLFTNAGYSDIQIIQESSEGWICGIGRKPLPSES